MNIFKSIYKKLLSKFFIPLSQANNKVAITSSEADKPIVPINSVNRLRYKYLDSSLPPKYHRSYEITLTPQKVYFSINSYGKILSNESLPITETKYKSFVTAILGLNIKNREEVKSDSCCGGTSDELDICIGKDFQVKGYVYHCGGEKFGNLEGDVTKATELFKTLIPNLKNRINNSIKK